MGQTATVALLREKPVGSLVTLVVASGPHYSPPPSTKVDEHGDRAGVLQKVSIYPFYYPNSLRFTFLLVLLCA